MFSKTINIYKILFFCLFLCTKASYSQSTSIYPTSISGLECWYAADSNITLNGTTVLQIKDLSPNQYHINQPNSSVQPLFLTNQINNKPALRFDAIDDYLPITDSVNFRTIIVLAKANETSFSDYRGLFGGSASTTFAGGYLINAAAGTNNLGLGVGTAGFTQIKRNAADVTTTGDFSPIDLYWVGLFEYSYVRKQPADIGRIDNGAQPGRYWKGDIAEIIVYNKVLNTSELRLIETYLSKKYTPPVSLGPDIVITGNSVCDTTLSTTVSYSNYLWSTGATTPTISVNKPGKYWVRIENYFGFYSYDTISLSYSNFRQLKTDSVLCTGQSIEWNINLPKSDFTFNWQDNSTDSLYTITQPGNYYVTISDAFGCSFTSDTAKITTDNFPVTASLGNDTSLCAGNQITLMSGLSAGLSYTWSTGSNAAAITVTNTGQYSVIVTNTNSCVAKDTINVTIAGLAPIADFTVTQKCVNNQTAFTDLSISSNSITSYSWNFGDPSSASNTSTLSNPFHTYNDTGMYTVNLIIKTNVGCEGNVQKNIHIAPTPTVNFTNGISCQNDSTSFSALATGGNYAISAYNWNFGDGGTSAATNPRHLYSSQQNYNVKLVVTNSAGCKDSLSKLITVRGQVKADFTYTPPCKNTPTLFQDVSIVPAPAASHTRLWSFSVPTNTASGMNPGYTFTTSGVHSVTLAVNGTNGCSSKITKLISVFVKPTVSFSVPVICAKDTFTVTNLTTPGSGVISTNKWKLNNTSFSTVLNPTLSLATAGNYTLGLTVTNSAQCRDSASITVNVLPLPLIDFSTNPPLYIYKDSLITFNPTITNGSYYNWTIDNTSSTAVYPTHIFDTTGTYQVTLQFKDANGCRNSKNKTIQVYDSYLDLAVTNITTSLDNNYLETKVKLLNLGSRPVFEFEIEKTVTDEGPVIEHWSGNLNPGNFLTYTFISKNQLLNSSSKRVVCATIKKVNFITDANSNNNNQCTSVNNESIDVFDPYPNPAESYLTLPVSVNTARNAEIICVDALGQILFTTSYALHEGLNFIEFNTDHLGSSCYLFKITIDNKTFLKKVLKR